MFASCCNFEPKLQHTTASIVLGRQRHSTAKVAVIVTVVDIDEAKMMRIKSAAVVARIIANSNATIPQHS